MLKRNTSSVVAGDNFEEGLRGSKTVNWGSRKLYFSSYFMFGHLIFRAEGKEREVREFQGGPWPHRTTLGDATEYITQFMI